MSPVWRPTRRLSDRLTPNSDKLTPNEAIRDDADEPRLAPMPVLSRNRPDQPPQDTPALRPWAILAALGLGRVAFGYQFQTVATLGPRLVSLFHLTYAEFGALIGAYMLLGAFVALPLGVLGRWLGRPHGHRRRTWADGRRRLRQRLGRHSGQRRRGPRHRRCRRRRHAGAAGQDHRRLVHWRPPDAGDEHCRLRLPDRRRAWRRLTLPSVAYGFGWPAGFLSGAVVPGLALVLFLASFSPSPHVATMPGALLSADPARVRARGHRRHDLHRLYRRLLPGISPMCRPPWRAAAPDWR